VLHPAGHHQELALAQPEKLGIYKYVNLAGSNYQNAFQASYRTGKDQASRCKLLEKTLKENDAWILLEGMREHNALLQRDLDDLVETFKRQVEGKTDESSLKETAGAIEVSLGNLRGYQQGVYDGCGLSLW
jgi:hypothetical protein